MPNAASRNTAAARTSLAIAALFATMLALDGAAVAQPKPPADAGTGAPAAGAIAVPEGQFVGPSRDGKAHGKGQLTLRSGVVVDDAEYQDGVQLGFVLCNGGDAAAFAAVVWRDAEDWTSKGWYRADPRKCVTALRGRLDRRYVAYRLDVGGRTIVGGDFLFCVHPADGFEFKQNSATCPAPLARQSFALADLGDGASRRPGMIVEFGGAPGAAAGGAAASTAPTPPPPQPAGVTNGTLEFADASYTGAIRDGKANGRGVMTYKDGSRLEGTFVDNAANGPGIWLDKNKHRWTGTFKDGLLSGKVKIEWSDGSVFEAADMDQGRILGMAVCSQRAAAIFGAIGYNDGENWVAKGWYRIDPNQCVYLRTGALERRYYYYRLVGGGAEVKGGEHLFCVHPENAFDMKDGNPCPATGTRAGFTQIDLGEGSAKKVGSVVDAPK